MTQASLPGSDAESLLHALDEQLQQPPAIRFPPQLEACFARDTADVYGRQALLAVLAVVAFYDAFLLAGLAVPLTAFHRMAALWLHLGVVTPAGAIAAWWLRKGVHPVVREVLRNGVTGVAFFGALALLGLAHTPQAAGWQVSLAMAVLYGGALASSSFLVAFATLLGGGVAVLAGALLISPLSPALVVAGSVPCVAVGWFALMAHQRGCVAERRFYLLDLKERLERAVQSDEAQGLMELARTDLLTGVGNRHMFDQELNEACRGESGEVAVLLIDVDHFRAYNDSHGSTAGDRSLAAVGAILQQQLRLDIDVLARYGGDEFAVILRHADLADAGSIAERIRGAVEDLAIPHDSSLPRRVMTISVGCAAMERGTGSPERLMDEASVALHGAKQAGRNCIFPPMVVSAERILAVAGGGKHLGHG